MSVPNKYKQLGTFHKYYSGETRAPYPTLFIGGNHEASNYLWELYYGGFVCPNVYYLGHSGVVNFGDLRVGGKRHLPIQRLPPSAARAPAVLERHATKRVPHPRVRR